ncbi:MAG: TonB-dependent receptor [Bacteroidales bacterium]|nr:MAG: TonB-dependent receptor [Bacteroidales bacterium]
MKLKFIVFAFAWFISFSTQSQTFVQTLRGVITDKETKTPLPGVSVYIPSTSPVIGSTTDLNGEFILSKIPIGRHTLQISYVGYKTQTISNIDVISGKENVVNITLEESVTVLAEVSVVGHKNRTVAMNQMSSISARTFSVEETGRYAGSRNDVSRMASNYAGVTNGNDSRNDIVIRGNSPMGLLWKLDELEIPSPNHFTGVGSSGGPVSMLNYNVIANSDFMTGAFPAEYGNASSGVFDIKLRNGNNSKREYMFQAGALGTELMLEGPFSNKYKGSFLINYRFSTTTIMTAMGIKFGYSGEADYQDLAFNFYLPVNDRVTLTFFGMGGRSVYKALYINKKEADFGPDGYLNTNNYYNSGTSVGGATLTYRLSNSSYLKTIIGFTGVNEGGKEDSVALDNSMTYPNYRADNFQNKLSAHTYLKTKLNAKNSVKVGIIADHHYYEMNTKLRKNGIGTLKYQRQGDGNTNFIQAYGQWSHAFSDNLTMNNGLHYQYLGLNGDWMVEPRLGLKWKFAPKQTLSFGYGLHGQMQILPLYMVATQIQGNTVNTNKNLKFSKSHQLVMGYNLMVSSNTALKAEVYYQQLFDIPVTRTDKASSYSAVNEGMSYLFSDKDSLVNEGTGRNYGLELTFERFFSRGYYYLVTTSLYDSKYKGSDGVLRNTAFNGKYVLNVLAGKEFKINDRSKFMIDLKVTNAGGKRYTPVNYEASGLEGKEVRFEDRAYSEKFDNYFRTDLKITYRLNSLRVAHEFFINIDNVFNTKNVFAQTYNITDNKLNYIYQLGVFPTFQYKIYF